MGCRKKEGKWVEADDLHGDFRDELFSQLDLESCVEASGMSEALEYLSKHVDQEVQLRMAEEMKSGLRRFLCEVRSNFDLDCARMALGMPGFGGKVSGEVIARKHRKSRTAVMNRKREIQRALGLGKSIYDRSKKASESARKYNHRNYKKS